jgi:MFS family permease
MTSDDNRRLQAELAITVYLPSALLAFGQGLLLTTLPLYIASLDVSYGLVSLVVGAAALGTLLTDVPAGALVGKLGLRPTMLVGVALVMCGTLALSFFDDITLLVAARIGAGIGTALWGISRHAYVATAVPIAMRGRAISIFGGVNRIGQFAGPAAGGVLAGWVSYQASFVAASLMAGVVVVLTLLVIKPSPLPVERSGGRGRWRVVGVVLRQNRRDLARRRSRRPSRR